MSNVVDVDLINLDEVVVTKASIDNNSAIKSLELNDHFFDIDYAFEVGMSISQRKFRIIFKSEIVTKNKSGQPIDVRGTFHIAYFFTILNLEDLAKIENEVPVVQKELLISLINIVYSTSRGIIYTRCQGTILKTFILPIQSTSKLEKIAGIE